MKKIKSNFIKNFFVLLVVVASTSASSFAYTVFRSHYNNGSNGAVVKSTDYFFYEAVYSKFKGEQGVLTEWVNTGLSYYILN